MLNGVHYMNAVAFVLRMSNPASPSRRLLSVLRLTTYQRWMWRFIFSICFYSFSPGLLLLACPAHLHTHRSQDATIVSHWPCGSRVSNDKKQRNPTLDFSCLYLFFLPFQQKGTENLITRIWLSSAFSTRLYRPATKKNAQGQTEWSSIYHPHKIVRYSARMS